MSAKTKFKPWANRPKSRYAEDPAMHRRVAESMSDDGLFAARLDLMNRELSSGDPAAQWVRYRLAAVQKEADRRSLVSSMPFGWESTGDSTLTMNE